MNDNFENMTSEELIELYYNKNTSERNKNKALDALIKIMKDS